MEDNDQELLVVTDEEGNETKLKVLEYFYYNGEEYAVMAVADDECDCCDEDDEEGETCEACGEAACDCCADEEDVFFMKVVPLEGDEIELQPVSDELADQLMEVLSHEEEDDEDEDGEDGEGGEGGEGGDEE